MSQFTIMEAIGYGPDSELPAPAVISIGDSDVHSNRVQQMRRDAEGLPVHSCERWIRLRFDEPGVQVALLRFWCPNLDPSPGWTLLAGVSDTWRKPTTSTSDIARLPVPLTDPGALAPNVFPLEATQGGVDQYRATFSQVSPWLVLQATWEADDDEPLQGASLEFRFAWEEGA